MAAPMSPASAQKLLFSTVRSGISLGAVMMQMIGTSVELERATVRRCLIRWRACNCALHLLGSASMSHFPIGLFGLVKTSTPQAIALIRSIHYEKYGSLHTRRCWSGTEYSYVKRHC
jgi:hypothetical protein